MNFDGPNPQLMGILNVTPDSFYDGGQYNKIESSLEQASRLIDAGVDIIDVGGESTRPGAESVDLEEEIDRVIPVVEALQERFSVRLSVDTTKPEVARRCLKRGVEILNVVTGLEQMELVELVAEHDAHVVIMHMQGSPGTMQDNPSYDNVINEVKSYFVERTETALDNGVNRDKIILDPGIGFGKTLDHNRKLLSGISSFKELGFPVMIGHSRKSFLEELLGLPVDERGPATLAVSAELINQNVDFLRVHDVDIHNQLRTIHHWLNGSREMDLSG